MPIPEWTNQGSATDWSNTVLTSAALCQQAPSSSTCLVATYTVYEGGGGGGGGGGGYLASSGGTTHHQDASLVVCILYVLLCHVWWEAVLNIYNSQLALCRFIHLCWQGWPPHSW